MKNLFSTLELVVEWIKDGIYDFYTLPKAMKRPLRKHDKQMILGLQQTYNQSRNFISDSITLAFE